MAGSMRCFLKLNLGLISRNVTRHITFNQTRTLFTEQCLGLTSYHTLRNHYKNKFIDLEESFRQKMRDFVNNDTTEMIFTEDLKVMLHLAEKTPEDLELLQKMLRKFNGQSSEMRFGTYNFGPVVMRSFHRLNEPEVALELFNDPEFNLFFNQLSSYQVFLDLLYKNEKYREMMNVYDKIQDKLTDGRVHPRNALILVTAACYKENSEESMQYAVKLWRDLEKRGYPTVRRVLTHLGGLAINQGKPHVALEMLSTARKPRYITIRCLKVMAYADLDRLDAIVPFFRSSLETDDTAMRKETWFMDTINKVEDAIERSNPSPDAEIRKLLKLIKTHDMIQKTTIDDHIDVEIHVTPSDRPSGFVHGGNQRNVSGPHFIRRPGLRDIV